MKKLLFLGACLVALASQPVMAQAGGPEVVVVKVNETYGSLTLDIARPDRSPEHREFNPKELSALAGNKEFGSGQAEATRRLLVELAQQGYNLTTTYQTTSERTTLVFTKRQ